MATSYYLKCASGDILQGTGWDINLTVDAAGVVTRATGCSSTNCPDRETIVMRASEAIIITPTSDTTGIGNNYIHNNQDVESIARKNLYTLYTETYNSGTATWTYLPWGNIEEFNYNKGDIAPTYYHYDNSNMHFSNSFSSTPSYTQTVVYSEGILPYDSETDVFQTNGMDYEDGTLPISVSDDETVYLPGGKDTQGGVSPAAYSYTWNVKNTPNPSYTIADILLPFGVSSSTTYPQNLENRWPFRIDTEEVGTSGITIRPYSDDVNLGVDTIAVYQCYYTNSGTLTTTLLKSMDPNPTAALNIGPNSSDVDWTDIKSTSRMISISSLDSVEQEHWPSGNKQYGKFLWFKVVLNLKDEKSSIPSGSATSYSCAIQFPYVEKDCIGTQTPENISHNIFSISSGSRLSDAISVNLQSNFKVIRPIVKPTVEWSYSRDDRTFTLPKSTSATSESDSSIYLGTIKVKFSTTGTLPTCKLLNFFSSSAQVAYASDVTNQFDTFNDLSNTWVNHITAPKDAFNGYPFNHVVNFYADHTGETMDTYYDYEGLLDFPGYVAYFKKHDYGTSLSRYLTSPWPQTIAAESRTSGLNNLEWSDPLYFEDPGTGDNENILPFLLSSNQGIWLAIKLVSNNTYNPISSEEYGNLDITNSAYVYTESGESVIYFRMFANNKFVTELATTYSGLDERNEANKMISDYLENTIIFYPSLQLQLTTDSGTEYCYYPDSLQATTDIDSYGLLSDIFSINAWGREYDIEHFCNLTEWGHEIYLIRDSSTDSYSYGPYNKTLIENRNKIPSDEGIYRRPSTKVSQNLALTEKDNAELNMFNTNEVTTNSYATSIYPKTFNNLYGLFNIKDASTARMHTDSLDYELEDFCWIDMQSRTFKCAGKNDNLISNACITNKWKPFHYCIKSDDTLYKYAASYTNRNVFPFQLRFDYSYGILKPNVVVGDIICVVCRTTNTITKHTITSEDLSYEDFVMGNGAILWDTENSVSTTTDPLLPTICLYGTHYGVTPPTYYFDVYYIPKCINGLSNTNCVGYLLYSFSKQLNFEISVIEENSYEIPQNLSIPEH